MTKNLDPQGRDCQSLQRLTLVLCNQFKDFEREKLGCARCLVWGIILGGSNSSRRRCGLWFSLR